MKVLTFTKDTYLDMLRENGSFCFQVSEWKSKYINLLLFESCHQTYNDGLTRLCNLLLLLAYRSEGEQIRMSQERSWRRFSGRHGYTWPRSSRSSDRRGSWRQAAGRSRLQIMSDLLNTARAGCSRNNSDPDKDTSAGDDKSNSFFHMVEFKLCPLDTITSRYQLKLRFLYRAIVPFPLSSRST